MCANVLAQRLNSMCPCPCTGKGSGKDTTKLENELKEARSKLKEQESVIARLRADVSSLESKSELLVEKKALEVELSMRKLIEEAYAKGFDSCKVQFKALKELQSCL